MQAVISIPVDSDAPTTFKVRDVTYQGKLVNGLLNGPVKTLTDKGKRYEGEFKNNSAHGNGKIIEVNGNIIEGEFRNNLLHGKVKIIYKNGLIEDGICVNNLRHGFFVTTFPNGDLLEIEYKNGIRWGKGNFTNSQGILDCVWENGTISKNVTIKCKNGDIYVGNIKYLNFNEWCYHGYGKLTDSKGFIFEGDWDNGALTLDIEETRDNIVSRKRCYDGVEKDGYSAKKQKIEHRVD